jgi:hypothetical protein
MVYLYSLSCHHFRARKNLEHLIMYSEQGFDSGDREASLIPLKSPELERHLRAVGDTVANQISALLAEEDETEPVISSVVAQDEAEQAQPAILEGRVVETRQQQRIGKLGTKFAAMGHRGARISSEIASGLAAVGKPVARVTGELVTGAKDAANQTLDEMDRREKERSAFIRAQEADIALQRDQGSRGFCLADLKYELGTGKVSPRRVLPPPGIIGGEQKDA